MRRSTDGGEKSSAPTRVAAAEDYGPRLCSNSSPIADRRGELTRPLFCHNYERVFYIRTSDDGGTWPVSHQLQHCPSGYSDLAQLPDGTSLCVYECGVVSGQYDNLCIMLARIDSDDLLAEWICCCIEPRHRMIVQTRA
ncbi:MAG: exo-alpha-sialidase [Planctomycetes bacterium]|nr:exo-alpha-sialidase [Planctomycetota bacterium]